MTTPPKATLDSIKEAVASIRNQFGHAAVHTSADGISSAAVDAWISTGDVAMDKALGRGIPVGRLVEMFGTEGCGKSSLALAMIKETQRIGGIGVLFDEEDVSDENRRATLGIDESRLIYSPPVEKLEGLFSQMDFTIHDLRARMPEVPILVAWDSVAATSSRAEREGDYGDFRTPEGARVISSSMRKFASVVSKNNASVVFVNQVREKMGAPKYSRAENRYTTYGGMAVSFYSSIRIFLRQRKIIHPGDNKAVPPIGIETEMLTVKNKVSPPYRRATVTIWFDRGLDPFLGYLSVALGEGIVTKAGSWLQFEDKKFRRDEFPKFLDENKELVRLVQESVYGSGS